MKLMVIDGNSIVNRAFFGIRMLNAPDGTPTNGIYGFLTILKKLVDENSPEAIAVAFDLKGPTFRHKQYEGYKAQRKPMPEELAVQIPILKDVLDALGIARLEKEGYEADDIIGTLSVLSGRAGDECLIVTGDKDSFQLIDTHSHVLHVKSRMGRTETNDYTVEAFTEEYGFPPRGIIDLKALMGDASDNIPGVKGVGEKTALELIRTFGSLDGVYDNINSPDIKDSVRKKLTEGEEMARFSYELATIVTDVPLELDKEKFRFTGFNSGSGAHKLFTRLGFLSLIEKWGISPDADVPAPKAEEIESWEPTGANEYAQVEKWIGAAELISVLPLDKELDSLSLCDGKRLCSVSRLSSGLCYDSLLNTLFSPQVKKVSHNLKDLLGILMSKKLCMEGFVFDTALAAYLLEPTENSYELPRLSAKYVQRESEGARAVFELYPVLEQKLKEQQMDKLYYEIELPLCPVLADMEADGFTVDRQALEDFSNLLSGRIDKLQQSIWDLAGEEFNILSPKQLGVILFDKLMLPSGKKTKTGWSTNVDVMEKLRDKHPIVNQVLEYRQLTKLKSTYADGLRKVIAPDGRIHTSFQMTVTATGRLSSTEPNLQNIPVRTELGAEIRKMFVAPPGKVLVDADYSQIELRLLAHISGDEAMINAFKSGEDIHAVTASQVFNVPLAEVTPLMRSHAKAVNFGIVYGISAFSLAQDIGVYTNEAKAYIDAYLSKYHGVRAYMADIVEQARRDGFVSTLFGRRRPLPELKSSNHNLRSFGERVALNMPIQGTAADIIKLAMINVHRRLKEECPGAKLILQVHDELIAECPEDMAEQVRRVLTEEMENVVSYSVPLTADAHFARSWYDAK